MKFSLVIGTIDEKLVAKAEEKLSQVFLELGTRYNNAHIGSCIGGDPLIFALMYPVEHVCTLNMPTAATDGKRYYWNPKFVIKQSKIGLRIICSHEAWHSIYMHPQRRGSRLPKLWNIAVDYIVNGAVMEDFRARKMNPKEMFTKHLGKYMTLEGYANLIKDPFSQKEFDELKSIANNVAEPAVELPAPNVERDLSEKELKELERREKTIKFYYADPDLEDDMKRPENIYDYLYKLLPKCSKCGSVGIYKLPNHDKKPKSGKGCPECGGGVDIFGLGGTLDDHMDTEESQDKLAKRMSDAVESTRKMAGYVPGALEDELGLLTAPRVTWQDIIRTRLLKARSGNGRNDWTRFRTRPMFSGLLVPKRKNYYAHFGCLLDTSCSMGKADMAFGLSQLISLDERSEGTITCADAKIYWDQSTRVKTANAEQLNNVKIVGRGGTMFSEYFSDYSKHIGKCDFLIIITDGYLMDTDIANMKNPGIDVIWLITSNNAFKAPFGRVFDLRNI
jgi:predicted metal-dependent peptidase